MSEVSDCSLMSSPKEDTMIHEETSKPETDIAPPYLKVRIVYNQEVIGMDNNVNKQQNLKSMLQGARFFLLQSASWVNICHSQDNGVWAASPDIEDKLNAAYQQSPNVILILCVPQSSQYTGFARLVSESEKRNLEWETLEGIKITNASTFKIEWLSRNCVAFSAAMHLCKALDTSKPITTCNDGEELESLVGNQLCEIIFEEKTLEKKDVVDTTVLDKQDLRHKISPKNTPQHLDLRNELNFRVEQNNRLKKKAVLEPEVAQFSQHYRETSEWHYRKLGTRCINKNYDDHLIRYQYNRGIHSLSLTHKSQEHKDFESYIGTHYVRPDKYLEDIQQMYKEAQYRQKHDMKDHYKQSRGPYHHDHSTLSQRFKESHGIWQHSYGPPYLSSFASDYHHAAKSHREHSLYDSDQRKEPNHSRYHSPLESNHSKQSHGSLYNQTRSPIAWNHLKEPNYHLRYSPYPKHHQKHIFSPKTYRDERNLCQQPYHLERRCKNSYTDCKRAQDWSLYSHSKKQAWNRSQQFSHSKKYYKNSYTERVASRHGTRYEREYDRKHAVRSLSSDKWKRETRERLSHKHHHNLKNRKKHHSSSSKHSSDYYYKNTSHKTAMRKQEYYNKLQHRKKHGEMHSTRNKDDRQLNMNRESSHYYTKREKEDRYEMYKKLAQKHGKTKADNMYKVITDSSSSGDSSFDSSSSYSSSSSSSSLPSFDERQQKKKGNKRVYQDSNDETRKYKKHAATSTDCVAASPVLSDEVLTNCQLTETNSDVAKTMVCSDSAKPMTDNATDETVPSETITQNKRTNYLQICITGMPRANQMYEGQQHRTLILLTK